MKSLLQMDVFCITTAASKEGLPWAPHAVKRSSLTTRAISLVDHHTTTNSNLLDATPAAWYWDTSGLRTPAQVALCLSVAQTWSSVYVVSHVFEDVRRNRFSQVKLGLHIFICQPGVARQVRCRLPGGEPVGLPPTETGKCPRQASLPIEILPNAHLLTRKSAPCWECETPLEGRPAFL